MPSVEMPASLSQNTQGRGRGGKELLGQASLQGWASLSGAGSHSLGSPAGHC